MNHYAKLAALVFRVIAVLMVVYAVFSAVLIGRLMFRVAGMGHGASALVFTPIVAGFVVALLLYLGAPALGRVAARGFGGD